MENSLPAVRATGNVRAKQWPGRPDQSKDAAGLSSEKNRNSTTTARRQAFAAKNRVISTASAARIAGAAQEADGVR
jgi:hypothetical protein